MNDALRTQISTLLDWNGAHLTYEQAVADFPSELQGVVPQGLPYSAWQLLEHIRLAQEDIVEFCTNPNYEEKQWPDEYWPQDPVPPDADSWSSSIASYRKDLSRLKEMLADDNLDLLAIVPVGDGQTFLREFLLVIDHTAYHVGQLVAVRRLVAGALPKY